jgi:hypothetical protein
MRLHVDVNAPRLAREFARRVVDDSHVAAGPDLDLLIAEVANNVLWHASPWMELRVDARTDRVRVEVLDQSLSMPVPAGEESADAGFGLRLLDALASAWGADELLGGKVVWFELPCG